MKRDTVKTLAGLVVIAAIVVATFLYGNAQRQAQLKRDADKKQQASNSPQPSSSLSATTSGTPTPTPTSNTAPVKTPAGNTLQGTGGTGGQQPGQVAGASAAPAPSPSTSPAPAPGLPETGAPVAGMVGVTAVGVMVLALRRSKRAIVVAARTRR
jgi:hypothetical protein